MYCCNLSFFSCTFLPEYMTFGYLQKTKKKSPGFTNPCIFLPTQVSKPAPHWEGTAVINGEFKEAKLSDYRGKYLVFFFYPLDL